LKGNLLLFQLIDHLSRILLGEVAEKDLVLRLAVPVNQGPEANQRQEQNNSDQDIPSFGWRTDELGDLLDEWAGHIS
jgi:hypothetical protein